MKKEITVSSCVFLTIDFFPGISKQKYPSSSIGVLYAAVWRILYDPNDIL